MQNLKNSILMICIIITLGLLPVQQVSAAPESVVIVIDPGHGGENLGTDYLPIPEKEYNMTVALAMKAELETYQNVRVYLTHTQDVTMSLKERAEFARSVDADFLFSLHFNMSEYHTLYGSEIWIPSSGVLYSQGYSMGYEFLKEFAQMGLFNRGIKTRVGKNGDDYYGIIRECDALGIPAIIVEHCHVDHSKDIANLQSPELLQEFGIRDAQAVARYYALTSIDGTSDYSNYAPLAVPVPDSRVYQDSTSPEYVNVSLLERDRTGRFATFTLQSHDPESYLQYYSYSLDNGLTWSTYRPWLRGYSEMTATIDLGLSFCRPRTGTIWFKVLNQYDRSTISNAVALK